MLHLPMAISAHVFFDDAFDYIDEQPQANGYVKQLIRTINEAVRYASKFKSF